MTSAKQQIIDESRTPGERIAYDLVKELMTPSGDPEEIKPVVLRLDEVRDYVARKLNKDVENVESERRLKTAMLAAGMSEPPRQKGKDNRVTIEGPRYSIVATFPLDRGVTWGQVKEHYRPPDGPDGVAAM